MYWCTSSKSKQVRYANGRIIDFVNIKIFFDFSKWSSKCLAATSTDEVNNRNCMQSAVFCYQYFWIFRHEPPNLWLLGLLVLMKLTETAVCWLKYDWYFAFVYHYYHYLKLIYSHDKSLFCVPVIIIYPSTYT